MDVETIAEWIKGTKLMNTMIRAVLKHVEG